MVTTAHSTSPKCQSTEVSQRPTKPVQHMEPVTATLNVPQASTLSTERYAPRILVTRTNTIQTNVNGSLGSCCNEMDIWEANSLSTQLTPHPCTLPGPTPCLGSSCTDVCDPSGCDFNPFRMGSQSFYGPSASDTIDTTQPFTVVTQFITSDNTPTGTLSEIRRVYVQNGNVFQNPTVTLPNLPQVNAITEDFCTAKESVLGDASSFTTYGGLPQMGESLARNAVLVISLWDSLNGGMDWLDGLEGSNPSSPGALRGPCAAGEDVSDPAASVTFSNIKVGDLNSTFVQPVTPPPSQIHYGQWCVLFFSFCR